MKKFFALTLTVAMLLVAGSAMAASSITVSPTTVSVAAGSTASATLTATAGHTGGQFGAFTVTGVDWALVSGTTVVFAPNASVTPGSYTVTVTAVETYTDGPAGHGAIATETATATIPVTVTRAAAGTYIVTRVVETVTTVTRSVTVISRAAQRSAVVQTFTETIRTVAQTITTAVLTQVEGYTPVLASYWSAQTTTIETARSTTVAAIASNPATKAAVFPGLGATVDVTPRANTSLIAATSSVSTTTTVTQKLAAATDALGGAGKALSAQEAVQAVESGTYSFVKTFGSALYGTKIKGHKGRQNRTQVSNGFAAAAVDNTGVAFLNSAGEVTEVIPGDENSRDIMPGYVTMLVVMEAGEVCEPVIYATEDDLAASGVSVDQAPVSVDIQQVTETVVKEEVTVDEYGNTTVTELKEADPAVVTAMKAVMGDTLVMVPDDKRADVQQATITTDNAEAAYQNLHVAGRTAAFNDLAVGTYYTPISFQTLASDRSIKSGAEFTFYPDGVTDGTQSYVKVFDDTGAEVTDPASMVTTAGKTGYIAFVIENTGIKDANADSSLANPTLTLEMNEATPTPTPTPTPSGDVYGVGSSSGGCSAGSAVLALALLGTFIAARKK